MNLKQKNMIFTLPKSANTQSGTITKVGKKLLAPALGLFIAGIFAFEPALAQQGVLIDGLDNPSGVAGSTTAWGGSIRTAILTILNFFLFFLGVIATAFVIYGGFIYVTSAGDDGKTDEAKKIITYAAIGIFVVLISFALINTLLGAGSADRANT